MESSFPSSFSFSSSASSSSVPPDLQSLTSESSSFSSSAWYSSLSAAHRHARPHPSSSLDLLLLLLLLSWTPIGSALSHSNRTSLPCMYKKKKNKKRKGKERKGKENNRRGRTKHKGFTSICSRSPSGLALFHSNQTLLPSYVVMTILIGRRRGKKRKQQERKGKVKQMKANIYAYACCCHSFLGVFCSF